MGTLREIKNRINSVKSTQKITRAMKMISAAKLKKAQSSVINSRPFSNKMNEMLIHLVSKVDKSVSPFLQPREVKSVLLVVLTSERGMCGSFNSNLIKKALDEININYKEYNDNKNLQLFCVGKKGADYFTKRKYNVMAKFLNVFNKLEYSSAEEITAKIQTGYLNGDFDKVIVIYNEFINVGKTNIKVEQLLPVPAEEKSESKGLKSLVDYIYEPDNHSILNKLLPMHIITMVWRMLLESNASEQGARMIAMDKATENAGEMINSLNLSYNKARQSSITKELLEIVAGAEALKERS